MCSNKRRPPKARKSRAKAKKPKFLSLRLQFPADGKDTCFTHEEMRQTGGISTAVAPAAAVTTFSASATNSHQLDLFPLHPENQLQDRENQDQENVAYFFSVADGGATTLTGLLDDSTTTNTGSMSSHGTNNNSYRQEDLSPSSASLTYAYGGHECKDGAALVRNAMRNRERDSSEEKWVCYSEVVERKKVKEEEVTSSAVDLRITEDRCQGRIQRLCLKLDYEEILNAWCNKGPLYVDAESSQIVPDTTHDFFSNDSSCYNQGMGWGLWTVPEMVGDIDNNNGEMMKKNGGEEEEEEELMKLGQREASVLRYKEKRHNRLFSKKIRYQVRKLNAEKRPRLKGRFVKRS